MLLACRFASPHQLLISSVRAIGHSISGHAARWKIIVQEMAELRSAWKDEFPSDLEILFYMGSRSGTVAVCTKFFHQFEDKAVVSFYCKNLHR